MLVQYGCGTATADGWRNFDASPTLRLERLPLIRKLKAPIFPANAEFGDIVRGLPVPDASCDALYCSHILEHLALDDFRAALRNSLCILKPGATFRLVVPDLETAVRRYLADDSDWACAHFMDDAHLGLKSRAKGVRAVLASAFGSGCHLWIWDFKAMRRELADAGFTDIRRAQFSDGPEAFRAVEILDRWDESLGVECRRPGSKKAAPRRNSQCDDGSSDNLPAGSRRPRLPCPRRKEPLARVSG